MDTVVSILALITQKWTPPYLYLDPAGAAAPPRKANQPPRAQADAPTRRVKPPTPSSSFPLQTSSSRRRGSKRYPKLHTNLATIHEALWIPAFAGMTKNGIGGSGGPTAKQNARTKKNRSTWLRFFNCSHKTTLLVSQPILLINQIYNPVGRLVALHCLKQRLTHGIVIIFADRLAQGVEHR